MREYIFLSLFSADTESTTLDKFSLRSIWSNQAMYGETDARQIKNLKKLS